ncbi:peptidylprolyl isomerase [Brevundimonas sp. NPDC092305]|uniref:peptidylprolyl isomerase n=1 Tax=Brevundimonas sp. NPDC092305 TaxID=3363957 RepID=UPI0038147BD1
MDRRTVLHGLAGVAAVQAAPVAAPSAEPKPRVALETAMGQIVLELEDKRAPITAGNFLRYVDEHRFDGTSFYRAMKAAPGYGFVQGGTDNARDRVLPPIAHEPTTETGLSHLDGTISMARYAPGSATGDFFIIVGNLIPYDAGKRDSLDPLGFAAFGRVVEGMDLVRQMLVAPVSPTLGEGVMKGEMLEPRITITTARRLP